MCTYTAALDAVTTEDIADAHFAAARRSRAQAEETYREIEKALKGRA